MWIQCYMFVCVWPTEQLWMYRCKFQHLQIVFHHHSVGQGVVFVVCFRIRSNKHSKWIFVICYKLYSNECFIVLVWYIFNKQIITYLLSKHMECIFNIFGKNFFKISSLLAATVNYCHQWRITADVHHIEKLHRAVIRRGIIFLIEREKYNEFDRCQ